MHVIFIGQYRCMRNANGLYKDIETILSNYVTIAQYRQLSPQLSDQPDNGSVVGMSRRRPGTIGEMSRAGTIQFGNPSVTGRAWIQRHRIIPKQDVRMSVLKASPALPRSRASPPCRIRQAHGGMVAAGGGIWVPPIIVAPPPVGYVPPPPAFYPRPARGFVPTRTVHIGFKATGPDVVAGDDRADDD